MTWQLLLAVMALTGVYALIITSLVWLLRKVGVPARWAIILGFPTAGFTTGLLAAWAWPYDSCVLPNLWAVLLGDALYRLSSEHLGDFGLFRPPWVYPWAGAVLYGMLGLIAQAAASRSKAAANAEGRNMQAWCVSVSFGLLLL
jgi:hypothetical protein